MSGPTKLSYFYAVIDDYKETGKNHIFPHGNCRIFSYETFSKCKERTCPKNG